ncbi:MAG TPA: MOSC domain-containing protein [Stellaceae bacterium]|nr:MOSC domain-containing protein [Stellaceae bacterium]
MRVIGRIDSVWRYPVKSMRGEELPEIFASFSGVYGDRLFAFRSSAAPAGFPYLTGREQHQMLLYRPRFRHREKAAKPPNLAEAEALSPGLNPVGADPADLALEVETPTGEVLAIDDPALLRQLSEGAGDGHSLSLLRSERSMTDCRPISLISLQTARQLGDEVEMALDKRRFRANVYLDLQTLSGFSENPLVGQRVQIGPKVVLAVLERDPRCQMITLDPDTAKPNPEILRKVTRVHDGTAGVYGAILAEGIIRPGDPVTVLD